jgi:hypothetical protein
MLVVAGCRREEAVKTYIAPKDAPPGQVTASSEEQPDQPIHWTVPPGWKAVDSAPMSIATYQVGENPPLKATVSQVTAMASGSATVLMNVNRWRGQLGLPPVSEAEVAKLVKPVPLQGHEALLIDLEGPKPAAGDQPQLRMLASLIPDDERVWVYKLMGPADAVGAQKDFFEGMVKSTTFHGQAGATAAANPGGNSGATGAPASNGAGGHIPGVTAYTLPEGWQVDTQPRPMRVATIVVPSGNTQAEIIVTQLNMTSLADLKMNVNRWRGQVHLPPTDDISGEKAEPVAFPQGPGVLRDFSGPESEGNARLRQLVAMTQFPGSQTIWFFRFVGPYDVVTKNKPAFESFLKSLKFAQQ